MQKAGAEDGAGRVVCAADRLVVVVDRSRERPHRRRRVRVVAEHQAPSFAEVEVTRSTAPRAVPDLPSAVRDSVPFPSACLAVVQVQGSTDKTEHTSCTNSASWEFSPLLRSERSEASCCWSLGSSKGPRFARTVLSSALLDVLSDPPAGGSEGAERAPQTAKRGSRTGFEGVLPSGGA